MSRVMLNWPCKILSSKSTNLHFLLSYLTLNYQLFVFLSFSREASKQYQNKAFVPIKAIAVDMFPHTSHCELILYFKRFEVDLFKQS